MIYELLSYPHSTDTKHYQRQNYMNTFIGEAGATEKGIGYVYFILEGHKYKIELRSTNQKPLKKGCDQNIMIIKENIQTL